MVKSLRTVAQITIWRIFEEMCVSCIYRIIDIKQFFLKRRFLIPPSS